jgi:hypothetical protein
MSNQKIEFRVNEETNTMTLYRRVKGKVTDTVTKSILGCVQFDSADSFLQFTMDLYLEATSKYEAHYRRHGLKPNQEGPVYLGQYTPDEQGQTDKSEK